MWIKANCYWAPHTHRLVRNVIRLIPTICVNLQSFSKFFLSVDVPYMIRWFSINGLLKLDMFNRFVHILVPISKCQFAAQIHMYCEKKWEENYYLHDKLSNIHTIHTHCSFFILFIITQLFNKQQPWEGYTVCFRYEHWLLSRFVNVWISTAKFWHAHICISIKIFRIKQFICKLIMNGWIVEFWLWDKNKKITKYIMDFSGNASNEKI